MSDPLFPNCPARMSDGRMWTVYASPRVYNSYPSVTNNALRQRMVNTPGYYAPPYDRVAYMCNTAVTHAMANYQDGVLPLSDINQSTMQEMTNAPMPYSGPRRA